DESDVFILSNRFQFKRIKSHDIDVNNRNTMGILAARKVKSNPHHVRYIGTGNIQDSMTLYHENLEVLDIKDIPLMGFDATYSSVVKYQDFFIVDALKYTEKIKAPKPEDKPKVEALKLQI